MKRVLKDIEVDTKALLHAMVDAGLRTKVELAKAARVSRSHLTTVFRTGRAGELTVLRLERFAGRNLRVPDSPPAPPPPIPVPQWPSPKEVSVDGEEAL